MNVAYFLSILNTEKFSELIIEIDAVSLDMNLAIWDAIERGEIEVDEENDTVKLIKFEPSCDEVLADKLYRTIKHYADNKAVATRGRLNPQVKDPKTGIGYAWHEYIMSLQYLIDTGKVVQKIITVPERKGHKIGKKGKRIEFIARPEHTFAFLCLPENEKYNDDWCAASVNRWLAEIDPNEVK